MPRPRRPDSLTERERAVLALIRRGLTNEEIAATFDISIAGVKYHVSQILAKLAVTSREEAAAVWERTEPRRSWWKSMVAISLAVKVGGAAVLVAASISIGALAWGVARTSGHDPAPDARLSIIAGNDAELDSFGFTFTAPPADYAPVVSEDEARHTADGAYGGGKVDHLVLTHLTNAVENPTINQVVWVAVFDPQTVIAPMSAEPAHPNYALMFIDSTSGAFLSGFMR